MTFLPNISVIIPTLNNQNIIADFLKCLRKQSYPSNKMELLVIDGGSSDQTVNIAKQYGAKIIYNPEVLAEPGVNLGMNTAKGDLLMILAVDNFLKDKEAFYKMSQVFIDDSIFAAFPKHDSDRTDTIYSKYYNTFTDPFNHFVYGEAANARTFYRIYKTMVENDIFDVYDFSSNRDLPMVAFAQGFTVRSNYRRDEQQKMDDLLPVIDLVQRNKKIAYVHSVSLYHHTIRNCKHFFKKQRWATYNVLNKKAYGVVTRKQWFSTSQRIRFFLWPIYAFSVIFPTLKAIIGLIRDREFIWLLHPYLCFLSACASLFEVTRFYSGKQGSISRI